MHRRGGNLHFTGVIGFANEYKKIYKIKKKLTKDIKLTVELMLYEEAFESMRR